MGPKWPHVNTYSIGIVAIAFTITTTFSLAGALLIGKNGCQFIGGNIVTGLRICFILHHLLQMSKCSICLGLGLVYLGICAIATLSGNLLGTSCGSQGITIFAIKFIIGMAVSIALYRLACKT